MSTPPLWSLQEAAILLDEFLKARKGHCTRKQAIANVSQKLRQMAINNGQIIDDIYRNENGITFQMASLESAYLGKTILKPPTRLFTEIVSLYRTDYTKYKSILQEALAQAAGTLPTENSSKPDNDSGATNTVHKEVKNSNQTAQNISFVYDPVAETIRTILRNESATNPAGTTITYLQTKIVPAVGILKHAEIKKILDKAPWAKYRYGRWHYIEAETSSLPMEKPSTISEPLKKQRCLLKLMDSQRKASLHWCKEKKQ